MSFVTHNPGMLGVLNFARRVVWILHPESPQEYLETALSFGHLLDDLQPGYVVVDPILDAARDVLVRRGIKHVVLSPNTVREDAQEAQKGGIFNYPV
jgi:hypothetical protein